MRSAPLAYLAVFSTSIILGFNPVATKLLYALPIGFGPFAFISARPFWCLLMYGAIAFAFRPREPVARSDWWRFALIAVCYGPGTGGLLPLGVSLTSATHTVFLYALGPPLTAGLAALFLRESISVLKLVGIAVGISGATIVAVAGSAGNPSSVLGDVLVLGMVVSTAVQTLGLRTMKGHYSAFFIASTYGAMGSLMLLAVTVPLGGARYFGAPLQMGPAGSLLFFGEIIIGVSLLSQMFQSFALHSLKAGLVSALVRYGALLAGAVTAYFLLSERLSLEEFCGGALLALSLAFCLLPDGRVHVPHLVLHRHPDFHPVSG